jgi:FAD/FMN-containing dehydrogenase
MNETKRTALEQGLQQAGIAWEAARPLALDTTLRIGGPAALSAAPEREEALIGALRLARQLEIPVLVVGNGSNLLVSDRGFAGLVLRTGGLRQLRHHTAPLHRCLPGSRGNLPQGRRSWHRYRIDLRCGLQLQSRSGCH